MDLEKNKAEDSDRKMEKHFKMMDGKFVRLEEMIQGLLMIKDGKRRIYFCLFIIINRKILTAKKM